MTTNVWFRWLPAWRWDGVGVSPQHALPLRAARGVAGRSHQPTVAVRCPGFPTRYIPAPARCAYWFVLGDRRWRGVACGRVRRCACCRTHTRHVPLRVAGAAARWLFRCAAGRACVLLTAAGALLPPPNTATRFITTATSGGRRRLRRDARVKLALCPQFSVQFFYGADARLCFFFARRRISFGSRSFSPHTPANPRPSSRIIIVGGISMIYTIMRRLSINNIVFRRCHHHGR